LAWRAGRRGSDAGWLALALLTVMVLDATTRASFTGFPPAFVGFLLIGVALAAAKAESPLEPASARRRVRDGRNRLRHALAT
jgi:hypothetical protein